MFCLKNKIKLVYSATSASIGNNGEDKNLSPYAFTKAKNLETLNNLKKWFKFKFEIIYFYNVYGPNQIEKGSMATVIGIFEKQYKNNVPLTVVKPGSQTRRFTHVNDTVEACIYAWKKNKCMHYSISNKKVYSILEVAKQFSSKIKLIPVRKGERYASKLTSMNLSNKVHKIFVKIKAVTSKIRKSRKVKLLIVYNILNLDINLAGDYCVGVIPDPISNSEVKPYSANGTVLRHGKWSLPALTL